MMVLLSDGFDNISSNKVEQILANLQELPIAVNTLGYGESLTQLRDRARGKRGGRCNLSDEQLSPQNLSKNCKLSTPDIATAYEQIKNDLSINDEKKVEKEILNKLADNKEYKCKLDKIGTRLTKEKIIQVCSYPPDINEFIIDENFLETIADGTGGDYELSADANAVADSLIKFLKRLREYQLEYRQPNGDRSTVHPTRVKVNSEVRGLNNLISEPKNIRLKGFEIPSLEESTKMGIVTLLITGFVLLLFLGWSFYLKNKSLKDLQS